MTLTSCVVRNHKPGSPTAEADPEAGLPALLLTTSLYPAGLAFSACASPAALQRPPPGGTCPRHVLPSECPRS